jgi:hypothetical protein
MRVLAALVVVVGVLGCGAGRALPSSRGAFVALADAMARPDGAATVYAMLPAAERAALPFAEFSRRWDDTRPERERAASAARTVVGLRGPVAAIRAQDREAVLVEEPGGWRVADPALALPGGARTRGREGVRAALRGLHDAVRRRDFGAVLETLSGRLRGAVEAELSSLAAATEEPGGLEFPELPSGARVRLPDGRTLVFVWEDGQWRLDDVVGP